MDEGPSGEYLDANPSYGRGVRLDLLSFGPLGRVVEEGSRTGRHTPSPTFTDRKTHTVSHVTLTAVCPRHGRPSSKTHRSGSVRNPTPENKGQVSETTLCHSHLRVNWRTRGSAD